MNYEKTIIEVGSNIGRDTEDYSNDPNTFVYAFEPGPNLYPDLVEKFKDRPNVLVLPIAIDLENSIKPFNVCDFGDKGHGSLYDYHDDLKNTVLGKHYQYSTSEWTRKQNVLTMRLDCFMGLYNIKHIDYLHVDAQGNDWRVLLSLGEKLKRVVAGHCECMKSIPIYTNSVNNYYEDVQAYLDLMGFDTEILHTHADDAEVDLSFTRKKS